MATLLLVAAVQGTLAGTAASAFTVAAATGAAAAAGQIIDQKYLFPAGKPPNITGNRISGINLTLANEGELIFFCAGPQCRVPGMLIWGGRLLEKDDITTVRTSGGFKGESADRTEYFYYNSLGIAISEGEINTIKKIFGSGKILFDSEGGAEIGPGLSGFVDNFETLNNFIILPTGDFFGVRIIRQTNLKVSQREQEPEITPIDKSLVNNPNFGQLEGGGISLYNKTEASAIPSRVVGANDSSVRYQIEINDSRFSSETISISTVSISDPDTNEENVTNFIRSEQCNYGIRLISSNSSVEIRMNINKDGAIIGQRRINSLRWAPRYEFEDTYEQIGGTYIVFDGNEAAVVYLPNIIKTRSKLKIEIQNNEVKCFVDSVEVASNPWVNGTIQKLGFFTDVPAISDIPSVQGFNPTGGEEIDRLSNTMFAKFDRSVLQIPIDSGVSIDEGIDDVRYNSITLYNGDFNQTPDPIIDSSVITQQGEIGIEAFYYDDRNFLSRVGTTIDDVFSYDWFSSKPIPEITDSTNFSVDWILTFVPTTSSPNYQFHIAIDDYFLFTVTDDNGHNIIMRQTEGAHSFADYFTNQDSTVHKGDGPINGLKFTKGKRYVMRFQYANYVLLSRVLLQFRTQSNEAFSDMSKSQFVIAGSDECAFTPTFRGTAYFVLELLALADWGNSIPQISVILEADESLTVAELLTKILLRAGVAETDFDVSSVPSITVQGFMISTQVTTMDVINSILTYANLSVQQVGSLIRFYKNGQEVVYNIDADFLAANSGEGASDTPSLTITDIDIHGLPNEVDIEFYDIDRDLQPGIMSFRREKVFTESVQKISMPFAMTREQAFAMCERILWGYWADVRTVSLTLPEDFNYINQGDALVFDYKNETFRIKTTNIGYGQNGVMEIKGVIQQTQVNTQFTTGNQGSGLSPEHVVYVPGDLNNLIMNLPPIFGSNIDLPDGGYFFTAALLNTTSLWKGATFLESDDDSTFLASQEIPIEGFTGVALSVLADGPTTVTDNGNFIDIQLFNGTLETINNAQLLNEMNLAVLGEEIIAFRDVTELNPNQFRLSGLLRGLRDTVDHTTGHVVNERFALLDIDKIQFTAVSNAILNQNRFWKGLSLGQLEGDVTSFQQNITGENLVPFRPVDIDGDRDGSDNLTITWNRQDRASFAMFFTPPPMSEETLKFEIDILDGATVVRTIEATSETASYTAAEQTTDGLTPGDPVDVEIYQISVIAGRGNQGAATV